MVRRKKIRTRGKLQLSRYFQKLKEGEKVCVAREISERSNIPKRYQGRTGKVIGKRGFSYLVEIKDQKKPKTFILKPIHLKKITN